MADACEWDVFPMGTVDVYPGWNVQMLCPNANNIAEQQCRPHTMNINAVADIISAEANISDNLVEGIATIISSSSGMASSSNYQQSEASMSGSTEVSGQNS